MASEPETQDTKAVGASDSYNKYLSRKFIVTLSCIVAAFTAAYLGFLEMPLANVLTGGIISYNFTNAWQSR